MKCIIVVLSFLVCCTLIHANDVNRRRIEAARYEEQQPASSNNFLMFPQLLDHFIPASSTSPTFQQQYLVNVSTWNNNGPVFLIIGGEGPLSSNSVSQGTVVEYAQQFGALLFALEHRFYGASVPFELLNVPALSYLTTQQALGDLAYFQEQMVMQYNLTQANQWFVFGCSYSGALSAWYRLKYPQLAAGSSSSSSPVEAKSSFYQYDQVIGRELGNACTASIQDAIAKIEAQLDNADTNAAIKASFECQDVADDVAFLYVLADIVAFAVQYNTSYGLVPSLCSSFVSSTDTVATYIAYSQKIFSMLKMPCISWDISSFTNETVTPRGNMRQWMWQSCNELGYFQTAPANNSVRSVRITEAWHLGVCETLYGVAMTPRTTWTNNNYGGDAIVTSNTIFSNGGSDPWTELSVTQGLGSTVPSIIITGEAHCSNWYASNENDTTFLKNGRALASSYINSFLHPCSNNCNNNGACVTRTTGTTTVAAQCVCYTGFKGDTCKDTVGPEEELERMVPWWGILIAVFACLIVGTAVGWLAGAKYTRSKSYDKI